MGGSISALAFPAPTGDMDFYRAELMGRDDLVYLSTASEDDGRIPAVHVRSCSADAPPAERRMTILYSHGNAEDLGLHMPLVEALAEVSGCDVLSYEYVGYSLSKLEGKVASESGCLRSIDAAWRYLVESLSIPPGRIIIFGRSIGSGPTVDLASRECPGTQHSPLDAAGVLLQSPIASGARAVLGTAASVVGYPLDIFRNYRKVHKIRAPVAIMHGTADEVVPCENGRALFRSLQQPFAPLWMEGRGHNDMPDTQVLEYAKLFAAKLNEARAQSD
jgi:pimeloyl-ACP methyl ester carboxylesterase